MLTVILQFSFWLEDRELRSEPSPISSWTLTPFVTPSNPFHECKSRETYRPGVWLGHIICTYSFWVWSDTVTLSQQGKAKVAKDQSSRDFISNAMFLDFPGKKQQASKNLPPPKPLPPPQCLHFCFEIIKLCTLTYRWWFYNDSENLGWSSGDSCPLWRTGIHLREFFYREEAINYTAAILVDLRKMVFILALEEGENKPEYTQALLIKTWKFFLFQNSSSFKAIPNLWVTLFVQNAPGVLITPGHTSRERHPGCQQRPPTRCPSQEPWDACKRRQQLLLISLKFRLSGSWEWSCCPSAGNHESLRYLAAQGRSTALKPSKWQMPACLQILIWWVVLYLAQLGALLFIAGVNSLESLWAFVPLAFYQSGKMPQLLQPDDGPRATHTVSSLCGRFLFHCFSHRGKNCQGYMGYPLNSTWVPKSPIEMDRK